MIGEALGIYLGTLLAFYGSTMVLILTKNGWGDLPLFYVKLIEYIQSRLSGPTADSDNNNSNEVVIGKHHLTPSSVKEIGSNPFEMSTELLRSGVECILQDDVQRPFLAAPTDTWLMMSLPPVQEFFHYFVYAVGSCLRFGFLFPLRMMFLFTAIIWAFATGVFAYFVPTSQRTVKYFAITFAKLIRASVGTIVRGHDVTNRPKCAGIAVANHLTANDVFSLYSDCQYDGVCYAVTGQKHGGLAGVLEILGEKLTPCLWMDREDMKDRASFQKKVIAYASNPEVYPVLLFPEGFCTNNTTVLQFRKAVFTGEVPIYPMAIIQNSRVGDAFWLEDTFIPYYIRVMCSFANVYDVYYLPKMEKKENEDSAAFAARVQLAIAAKVGIPALPYDGGLKRPKNRQLYKEKIQASIFTALSAV